MPSVITTVRSWAGNMKKKPEPEVKDELRVLRRMMWITTATVILVFNLFWCQAMITYSCLVYDKDQICERLRAQYICILASIYLGLNSTVTAIAFCMERMKVRLSVIFLTVMTYAVVAVTAYALASDIINRGAERYIGAEPNCTYMYNSTDTLEDTFSLARFNYIDNIDLTFIAMFMLFMFSMMGLQVCLALYTSRKEDIVIMRQIRVFREMNEARRQAELQGRENGAVCLCQANAEAAMPVIKREEIQLAESIA